jgi:hypothetical protein
MAGEVVSITLLEGQTLNANQSAPNLLRIADISRLGSLSREMWSVSRKYSSFCCLVRKKCWWG